MEKAVSSEIFPSCRKYWSYKDSLDCSSVHFLNSATTESVSKKYLNHSTHTVKLPSSLKKLNLYLTLQKYQLRPQGLCSSMGSYKVQTSHLSCHQLQHLNLCEEVTPPKKLLYEAFRSPTSHPSADFFQGSPNFFLSSISSMMEKVSSAN